MPLLVQRFEDITRPPTFTHFPLALISPFPNKEAFELTFREAQRAWHYVYHVSTIRSSLQSPSETSYRYLKLVRKYGLILKAHYKFFHQQHSCPENLYSFLTTLGLHADYYSSPERQPIATKLLNSNLDSLEAKMPYSTTSPKGYSRYSGSLISEIQLLLEKDTLDIYEFHRFRRRIRLFMNIFQVPAAKFLNSPSHLIFYKLHELSSALGKRHDAILQLKITQNITTQTEQLDNETKKEVTTLLPTLSQALCL